MALSNSDVEVRLERLTSAALDESRFDKAILPLGATEFHGPHLPYGTDSITAEVFSEAIARELGNTLVLPVLSYGVSHHHLNWNWTTSLRPDTLMYVIRDIGESLLAHDIRKLVILSAHDGSRAPAECAARLLHQDHGINVVLFDGAPQRIRPSLSEAGWDIDSDHGGRYENSIVLYAAPETARPDLANAEPTQQRLAPVDVIGDFEGTAPKGYSGNAKEASSDEGRAIVSEWVSHVVPFLRQLDSNQWQRGGFMSGIYE